MTRDDGYIRLPNSVHDEYEGDDILLAVMYLLRHRNYATGALTISLRDVAAKFRYGHSKADRALRIAAQAVKSLGGEPEQNRNKTGTDSEQEPRSGRGLAREAGTKPEQNRNDAGTRQGPDYIQDQETKSKDLPPLPPKGGAARQRRISLPEGFAIDGEMKDWFRKKYGSNFPASVVEREHEKFMLWAQSSGKRYIDWRKTWMNWMLNAPEKSREFADAVKRAKSGSGHWELGNA